jgi:hypothetical protein
VLDELVRTLWDAIGALQPLVMSAEHPEGAPGVYLATHDEEGFGDKSAFMAEEEARLGETSTFFVLPEPLTVPGLKRLAELGAEVALHWHRGFGGGNVVRRVWGASVLGPLLPDGVCFRREAWTLAWQKQHLESKLEQALPPLNRVHGLQWDPDFDSSFRRLVAAGIRLDSSYGPYADFSPWAFGAVTPFQPLDRDGQLLPILELPFVLQDDEAEPLERLRSIMAVGRTLELPIVPIFHCNTMAYKPSVGPLEAWIEGFSLARRLGMWRGTLGQWLVFWDARAQVQVEVQALTRTSWAGRVKVPTGTKLQVLEVAGETALGDLLSVTLDGRNAEVSCRERGGRVRALVKLPEGESSVSVSYGRSGRTGVCGGRLDAVELNPSQSRN